MIAVFFQFLIYPGLLWVITFCTVIASVLGVGAQLRRVSMHVRRLSFAHQLSLVLALVAIALLPWPRTTFAPVFALDLWRIWALSEASFLVALLPALAAQDRSTHMAAIRQAQVGVAGRVALWAAVYAGSGGSPTALALAAGATLIALPVAAGAQPQSTMHPDIVHFLHSTLVIALITSFLVTVPLDAWWKLVGLQGVIAIALALWIRWLMPKTMALRTEAVLRLCFFGALPLALIAAALR